jgi:uncharacterized protein (TIGR02231 family)
MQFSTPFSKRFFAAGSLSVAALLASGAPGFADSFQLDAEIESVVLYPGAAKIVRAIPYDLPEGEHEIVVELNTAGIDLGSVRISGAGTGGTTLQSVDTRQVEKLADTGDKRRELEDRLKALRTDVAALDRKRSVIQTQEKLVSELAEAIPDALSGGENGSGRIPSADELLSALETLAQAQGQVVDASLELDAERTTLTDEIAAVELELKNLPQRRSVLEAVIRIKNDGNSTGELELSYLTGAASWQPAYDLSLDTEAETLSIRSNADVFQRTGEDWTDIALQLSTARPSGAIDAGPLMGEVITFLPKQPKPSPKVMQRSTSVDREAFAGALADSAVAAPVSEASMVADFSGFKATFTIPGNTTIASSNGKRTVLISDVEADVSVETRATPILTSDAFVHAKGTLPEGVSILPGSATLFRDGDLVGGKRMDVLNAGAEFDFGFGVDDRFEITRTVADRSKGQEGFISSSNVDRTRVTIEITNRHDETRPIRLIDRVPVAIDDTIEVETDFNGDAPSDMRVGDVRGVMGWDFELAAGETRKIDISYTINWPKDQEITRSPIWPDQPNFAAR